MRTETNRIEFKRQLTEDLEKESVAFLNYPEGGIIQPALKLGLIEMTIPDKPNSRLQKYRLTAKGDKVKLEINGGGRI